MGSMTNGSAAINSTVKPGRTLMHLSDSSGDFGPGSILNVCAPAGTVMMNVSAAATTERMIDLAGCRMGRIDGNVSGRTRLCLASGSQHWGGQNQRERQTSTSATKNKPMLIIAFT